MSNRAFTFYKSYPHISNLINPYITLLLHHFLCFHRFTINN
jgi:hypothetical protein